MEKFYTVKEVAKITSFAEGTIRNKICAGDIEIIKIGGGTRITEEALNKFLGIKTKDGE